MGTHTRRSGRRPSRSCTDERAASAASSDGSKGAVLPLPLDAGCCTHREIADEDTEAEDTLLPCLGSSSLSAIAVPVTRGVGAAAAAESDKGCSLSRPPLEEDSLCKEFPSESALVNSTSGTDEAAIATAPTA